MSVHTSETKATAAGDGRYDAALDEANDDARAWLSSVFGAVRRAVAEA